MPDPTIAVHLVGNGFSQAVQLPANLRGIAAITVGARIFLLDTSPGSSGVNYNEIAYFAVPFSRHFTVAGVAASVNQKGP
jgi:hypothetical protein